MPNPYHDGTGRFCSKGEMRSAIDKAARSGNMNDYFNLRTEYEAVAGESYETEPQTEHSSNFGNLLKKAKNLNRKDKKYDSKMDIIVPSTSKTYREMILEGFDPNDPVSAQAFLNREQKNVITRKDVYVTTDDLRSYDTSTRDTVDALKNFGAKITKDDAELISSSLREAHSAGYAYAINMELGDQKGYDYNSDNHADRIFNQLSFFTGKDQKILEETFRDSFEQSYRSGSSEGFMDS